MRRSADRQTADHMGGSSRAYRRSVGHASRSAWLRPGCSRRPVRRCCPALAGGPGAEHDMTRGPRSASRGSRLRGARAWPVPPRLQGSSVTVSPSLPGRYVPWTKVRAARDVRLGGSWHCRGGGGSTRRSSSARPCRHGCCRWPPGGCACRAAGSPRPRVTLQCPMVQGTIRRREATVGGYDPCRVLGGHRVAKVPEAMTK
jgi:hypothetical protein